ncbi:response regulator [Pseudoroseomonas globiformis]|uniref:Response regulator n=1 Tax=Teichococcus globiformis TaxID=2307229 RepID=A0ABV7G368_9PROT
MSNLQWVTILSDEVERWPDLYGRTILIVEDEFYIAIDFVEVLGRHGAVMLGPVPACDEAMMLLDQSPRLDLAILDINLRGHSVFPVADRLEKSGIPFVFVSGYDRDILPERFRNRELWQKPVAEQGLRQMLSCLA